MKEKFKAIIFVLLCTIFTVSGQISWKFGSERLAPDFFAIITNVPLILGFLFYGVAAILLILALRLGDLSLVYPFVSTSFIWVSLLSPRIFGEQVSPLRWFAVFLIVIGVAFVGSSGGKKRK